MCNRAHGNGKTPTHVDAGHFTFDPSPHARPKLGSQMAKLPHAEPFDKIMDQFSAANQCQNFQMLSKNSKLAKILLLIILERLRIQTSSSFVKTWYICRSVFVNLKRLSYFLSFLWLGFLSRNYWELVWEIRIQVVVIHITIVNKTL